MKINVTVRERKRDGAPWFEVVCGDRIARNKYGACMGRDYSRAEALKDFARRASIESRATAAEPPVRVSDLVEVEGDC